MKKALIFVGIVCCGLAVTYIDSILKERKIHRDDPTATKDNVKVTRTVSKKKDRLQNLPNPSSFGKELQGQINDLDSKIETTQRDLKVVNDVLRRHKQAIEQLELLEDKRENNSISHLDYLEEKKIVTAEIKEIIQYQLSMIDVNH